MKKKKGDTKTVIFESVGDFLVAAAANKNDASKCSQTVGDSRFYGTETFDEAVELARKGWPEGLRRLLELRATLDHIVQKSIAAKTSQVHWDTAGDFLDIGRYMTGDPECIGEFREDGDGQLQAKVVRLVANVSAMGGVESESIFSAGASLFAAVDIIESLGHRVELWLGSGSEHNSNDRKLQVFVLVKEACQNLDADRLAFFMCSNASLRRLFFSVEEDLGFDPGVSSTTPLQCEEGMVVSPEVQAKDCTQEKRVERVIQVCESVGIRFTEQELESITSQHACL